MRFAIDVAPLGELADPHAMVRLAVAAERAGWDGLSTWDVLGTGLGTPAADPFVALAAVASATTRLRLIASVIVLPRRRPQLVAQAAASLDAWSGGRFVLGIGAGGDPEDFTAFGEAFDAPARVARLDGDAARIDAWLRGTGEPPVALPAVQAPRLPIWVGGSRPGALRRAAAYDGWIAVAVDPSGSGMSLAAETFGEMAGHVRAERARLGREAEPLDLAVFAMSEPEDTALVAGFEAAGATWWLESLSPLRGGIDDLLRRVEAGPPRTTAAGPAPA